MALLDVHEIIGEWLGPGAVHGAACEASSDGRWRRRGRRSVIPPQRVRSSGATKRPKNGPIEHHGEIRNGGTIPHWNEHASSLPSQILIE
jgi:hypothetical protein